MLSRASKYSRFWLLGLTFLLSVGLSFKLFAGNGAANGNHIGAGRVTAEVRSHEAAEPEVVSESKESGEPQSVQSDPETVLSPEEDVSYVTLASQEQEIMTALRKSLAGQSDEAEEPEAGNELDKVMQALENGTVPEIAKDKKKEAPSTARASAKIDQAVQEILNLDENRVTRENETPPPTEEVKAEYEVLALRKQAESLTTEMENLGNQNYDLRRDLKERQRAIERLRGHIERTAARTKILERRALILSSGEPVSEGIVSGASRSDYRAESEIRDTTPDSGDDAILTRITELENRLRALKQSAGIEDFPRRKEARTKRLYRHDIEFAVVSVEQANLWTGPRWDDSMIYTVDQGTRLPVELRQGEWYRVKTPNGIRAWIHSSNVVFGRDAKSPPGRVARAHGFRYRYDNSDY